MTRRSRLAASAALASCVAIVASLACLGMATGNTSHAGWPHINGKLVINSEDLNETIRGLPNKHNELLGGNGNDTIYGGQAGDVIWGDYKPSGQPTTQVDRIYAGNGKNFIYTSHGTNYVYTGTGPTIVHAHFGRGAVYCQSSRVMVETTHHSGYKLHGCRHVTR